MPRDAIRVLPPFFPRTSAADVILRATTHSLVRAEFGSPKDLSPTERYRRPNARAGDRSFGLRSLAHAESRRGRPQDDAWGFGRPRLHVLRDFGRGRED